MTRDSLEQELLADNKFQHILKFAPQSQRELMTFELANYFHRYTAEKVLEAQVAATKYFIDEVWGSDSPDEIYPKLVAKSKTLQAELSKLKEEG